LLKIQVRVFASLREILGKKELELHFRENATVMAVLGMLSEEYSNGKLGREIFDENGKVRKYVKILVNGRDIDFLNGPSTTLSDGDVIAIFPPVGGG
jgi:molybdopterin synthase sulfur carrier subunit